MNKPVDGIHICRLRTTTPPDRARYLLCDDAAGYPDHLQPESTLQRGLLGTGQTIALVEDTDTYGGAGDWNTYRTTFGLATAFPQALHTVASRRLY